MSWLAFSWPFLLRAHSQRKTGLFKKAYELGVLCSVDIAVIIFGTLFPFSHHTTHRIPSQSANLAIQTSCSNTAPLMLMLLSSDK